MEMGELPPNQHLAAPGKWPVVGERAPRDDDSPWTVTVCGLVVREQTWTLEQLQSLPWREPVVDIHCVTRWSRLGATFGGVALANLLHVCGVKPEARFLSFVARSDRHHTTSLPLQVALDLQTLVAFTHNGEPLETIHGGPVRTVVPGRYFYKSLKWLERIEVLAEDRLGYWEAETGYHNNADPWQEERYIAPNTSRQTLERALRTRDFSGLDLRGIKAEGRDLSGLVAVNAKLRDARFNSANLSGANFTGANLSNAQFVGADLTGANLTGADAEGAVFEGANLSGANFTGASLFGATFIGTNGNAVINNTTQIPRELWDALAPDQQAYLQSCFG